MENKKVESKVEEKVLQTKEVSVAKTEIIKVDLLEKLKQDFISSSIKSVDYKTNIIFKIKAELEKDNKSEDLEEWCIENLEISSRTYKRYLNRRKFIDNLENSCDEELVLNLNLSVCYYLTDPKNEGSKAITKIMDREITNKKELDMFLAIGVIKDSKEVKLDDNLKKDYIDKLNSFTIVISNITDEKLVEATKLMKKLKKIIN